MDTVETTPPLFAILDIEAVMIGKGVDVPTEAALLLVDADTRDVRGSWKWEIWQPHSPLRLAQIHGLDERKVFASVRVHERLTGKRVRHVRRGLPGWPEVRQKILDIITGHGVVWTFSRGPQLERRLFPELRILDLQGFGCPKFPAGRTHDPLDECMFFRDFVPKWDRELQSLYVGSCDQ